MILPGTLLVVACATPPAIYLDEEALERSDSDEQQDHDGGDSEETPGQVDTALDTGDPEPTLTGDCTGGGWAEFLNGRGEAVASWEGEFPAKVLGDFDGFTELCGVESDSDWLVCSLSTRPDCASPLETLPGALVETAYVCAEASAPTEPTVGTCGIETGAGLLGFRVVVE